MKYSSEIANNYKYRPLHGLFEVKDSDIEGQGLFVKYGAVILSGDVLVNNNFCKTHIVVDSDIVRTPVGGFLNHSDTPNCKIELVDDNNKKFYKLIAIKPLVEGDEVTVSYKESKICL